MSYYYTDPLKLITINCLENNITDYKTCYEFSKLKNEYLLADIKKRYEVISYFEPIIKNCIDNNIDETQCYCSKKNMANISFLLVITQNLNILMIE